MYVELGKFFEFGFARKVRRRGFAVLESVVGVSVFNERLEAVEELGALFRLGRILGVGFVCICKEKMMSE